MSGFRTVGPEPSALPAELPGWHLRDLYTVFVNECMFWFPMTNLKHEALWSSHLAELVVCGTPVLLNLLLTIQHDVDIAGLANILKITTMGCTCAFQLDEDQQIQIIPNLVLMGAPSS